MNNIFKTITFSLLCIMLGQAPIFTMLSPETMARARKNVLDELENHPLRNKLITLHAKYLADPRNKEIYQTMMILKNKMINDANEVLYQRCIDRLYDSCEDK
jgi:hypothetical protein